MLASVDADELPRDGRGAGPEEICAAMRYLLDAPAVTGQLICVDGGQHLAWETPDVLGVE
jgi:NAD(P)-dependent dehydrogenase (short-subunit alcohol dehydrogenase family)